ncbi:hypothetical protein CB0940_06615 [Cercospora beticola]|uniref:BTB domain-containing protein n=1 Tax=Cercospora beticola TaxID=122368 RepID=A0A2G5HYL9_CERBT|nr:hypothetical protein CB0940_06615 [Cercospora beticola]PIA97626.1 hypothetical protein CB0940_06615 [Cercospora beticola]
MPPVDLPKVEIATDGDLIITVNSQIELLVQSQFLTTLSPAFRAMLGSEWLRGQSLLFISAAIPGRLNLPDDEAEAMKLLFLVLHNQNDRLPFLPTPKNFLDLAKAAQKYECIPATRTALTLCCTRVPRTGTEYEHLAATYILDEPLRFELFSRNIVLRRDSIYIRQMCKKVIDSGDEFGLGAILLSRHQVAHKLIAGGISYMVEEMVKLTGSHHDYPIVDNFQLADQDPPPGPCRYYQDAVSYHLRLLTDIRLWPEGCRTESLTTVRRRLKVRKAAPNPLPGYHGGRLCCEVHHDNWFERHYEPGMKALHKMGQDLNIKMCLDCLKSPSGLYNGWCRIGLNHRRKIIPDPPASATSEIRDYLAQMRQELGDI